MTKSYGYEEFKEVVGKPLLKMSFLQVLMKIMWDLHKIKVELGMDKKMRKQVGKPLKKAETLVKKAEKNNAKLANYDEKERDPLIAKAKKAGLDKKKGAK